MNMNIEIIKIIMIDTPLPDVELSVRFWDLAATEQPIEKVNLKTKGNGPDYTVGVIGHSKPGFSFSGSFP